MHPEQQKEKYESTLNTFWSKNAEYQNKEKIFKVTKEKIEIILRTKSD